MHVHGLAYTYTYVLYIVHAYVVASGIHSLHVVVNYVLCIHVYGKCKCSDDCEMVLAKCSKCCFSCKSVLQCVCGQNLHG